MPAVSFFIFYWSSSIVSVASVGVISFTCKILKGVKECVYSSR